MRWALIALIVLAAVAGYIWFLPIQTDGSEKANLWARMIGDLRLFFGSPCPAQAEQAGGAGKAGTEHVASAHASSSAWCSSQIAWLRP